MKTLLIFPLAASCLSGVKAVFLILGIRSNLLGKTMWLRIGNENLTNLPAGGILSVRGKSGISYFRNPFESAGQDHIWGGGGGYF